VWAVIASFFVGNVILLALNLPLVGLWAKLLHLPFQYLWVGVLLFCVVGAYSLQQSVFDVWVMIAFGVIGFVFRKLELPLAPLVLGLILGPAIEKSLRISLEMSAGDYSIFLTRPLCLGMLIAAAAVLAGAALRLAPQSLREA
jgi:putative tricarboxylic transport membrane protein